MLRNVAPHLWWFGSLKTKNGFEMFMLDGVNPPAAKAWAYSSLQPLSGWHPTRPPTEMSKASHSARRTLMRNTNAALEGGVGLSLSCLGNSIGYHSTGDEAETTWLFVAASRVNRVPKPSSLLFALSGPT